MNSLASVQIRQLYSTVCDDTSAVNAAKILDTVNQPVFEYEIFVTELLSLQNNLNAYAQSVVTQLMVLQSTLTMPAVVNYFHNEQ